MPLNHPKLVQQPLPPVAVNDNDRDPSRVPETGKVKHHGLPGHVRIVLGRNDNLKAR